MCRECLQIMVRGTYPTLVLRLLRRKERSSKQLGLTQIVNKLCIAISVGIFKISDDPDYGNISSLSVSAW